MLICDCVYGILALILSIIVINSDLTSGLIKNKTLLFFTVLVSAVNIVYFGFFARELFLIYLINIVIVVFISAFLFYTHSFAGGDSKLAIVLSLCYPANYYLSYEESKITLVFAIGLAILGGYIYLLVLSLINLIHNKTSRSHLNLKNSLIHFVKTFCIVMVYITAINVFVMSAYNFGFIPNSLSVRIACLIMAWFVGRNSFFRKSQMIIGFIIIDILGALYLQKLPFSIYPSDYVLIVVLLLCQLMISSNLYENVKIDALKKGMILSAASTLIMQGSKIQGLPKISTEDLRSRLSEKEVNSVCCWASKNNIDEVSIVRKIPFAIFLTLGYMFYFLIWCVI